MRGGEEGVRGGVSRCEGVRVGASRHLSGQFLVLLRLACEDMPLLVDHLLHHLGTPQAVEGHPLN